MKTFSEPVVKGLIKECYGTALEKGWHDEARPFGTVIALLHSEVTEAFESKMPDGQDNMAEELADVLIRIYDACGEFGIELRGLYEEHVSQPEPRTIVSLDVELLHLHRCISQALEAYRSMPENVMWHMIGLHFSDVCRRIYTVGDFWDLPIDEAVSAKMEKNKLRPHRHGGKRA